MTEQRHAELGDFLRSRREKLRPSADGASSGRRRRTPGMRREEVAELAGIGVDWYTRLEQGRAIGPSAATVDALAHALRLDKAEHAHLRALTRNAGHRPFSRETVPATIVRLVAGLNQPAYVTGRRWDILAWNVAAARIFLFDRLQEENRNVLLYMLLSPEARLLFGAGWADEAKRMVAQFRATHDLWAGDPAFVALLGRLRLASADFDDWWEDHEVRGIVAGSKQLHHPRRGLLRYEYATFQANDDPALKLVLYTPI